MVSRTATDGQLPAQLHDVVEVRSHPTVVRLDHLAAADAEWISAAYHLTQDVHQYLHSLQTTLERAQGCGIFVVGQYGSGKSHFLAYVAQNLARSVATSADPDRSPSPLRDLHVHTQTISLLNHRGDRVLEDIVHESLGIRRNEGDRRLAWETVAKQFPHGVLLILDELSEFLRSKPSQNAFHEDVRFLQFLGEWAQDHPLWIVAAVQEQIEHLGDLESGMYRKIKDRFPLRFLLSPSHIVDLLSSSILIKKPGYEQAVERILQELRIAFPTLAKEYDDLREIFPLHPATLNLLEEVRDRFSQARGIVDFTVNQLQGNPERGIACFLDQPADSLLTPDLIIDHFRDLFELQPDLIPFSQQLLPYYRKHLSEVFETEKLQTLAWRLLKLLMLTYISPVRDHLTADQAVRWLLYRAAKITPEKNLAIVQRVLDTLVERGRYVREEKGRYSLNLDDDGGVALDRFLEREKNELRQQHDVVLEMVAPLLSAQDFHPFAQSRDVWQARRVRWHFHEREYSVYVGNEQPPQRKGITFCVRLPWGEQDPALGVRTILPRPIEIGEAMIELAALARASERYWTGHAGERLQSKLTERLDLLRHEIQSAYRDATILGPTTEPESFHREGQPANFEEWLDQLAIHALRKTYPSFSRFAPVHGPLPLDAFRALMRFASHHDICQFDADDQVKLIREAYLVPMNLLKRKGRDYAIPTNPENAELVRLVLPLIQAENAPHTIYEQLQGPIYGLVPDQITLLLLYLLILGEIDIRKGKTSYRDGFETLPNPIQYDRVVPGQALRIDQLNELTQLCDAFAIRLPKNLTVLAQRRAAGELRESVAREVTPLRVLQAKLATVPGSEKMVARLAEFVGKTKAWQSSEDVLHAFQQFLFEVGTAARFRQDEAEFRKIAERVDRWLDALKRFEHLLSHPVVKNWPDEKLQMQFTDLGHPPRLDETEALDVWLTEAGSIYAEYQTAYEIAHRDWWTQQSKHDLWSYRPHPLTQSRHLGLENELLELDVCRRRAQQHQCRSLVNLDFQPVCHCGFDGRQSPLASDLERFERLRDLIETGTRQFFAQDKVRQRVQEWVDEQMEVTPPTLDYLAGSVPVPQITDVTLFDRFMGGVESVRSFSIQDVVAILTAKTWDARRLAEELGRFFHKYGTSRLRADAAQEASGAATEVLSHDDVLPWCVEQSLRAGTPLPRSMTARASQSDAAFVHPEWIGSRALARLETLGLGNAVEERIIRWLIEGHVEVATKTTLSPLVRAIVRLQQARDWSTVDELSLLSAQLYAQHHRLLAVAPQTWLARLNELASAEPQIWPPALTDVLAHKQDCAWVVIDAWGLPLLESMRQSYSEFFPGWECQAVEFATVNTTTTTDQWYRDLVDSGIRKPLAKFNAIDQLLHERFVPLDDLWRLATVELSMSFRKLWDRLPADQPLLVFADHGFRIAADGRSYSHGGSSALERIVPLMTLMPNT
ncbi:MAG: hypothetical protein KDA60_10670 [Planctomycetales bacterium]|nr:hypothetical protein [Planctomycetales bacterium]